MYVYPTLSTHHHPRRTWRTVIRSPPLKTIKQSAPTSTYRPSRSSTPIITIFHVCRNESTVPEDFGRVPFSRGWRMMFFDVAEGKYRNSRRWLGMFSAACVGRHSGPTLAHLTIYSIFRKGAQW